MRVRLRKVLNFLCWCLISVGLSSCAFDTGHDYAVTVTWLINGTNPSAALCAENGIDRIRLVVRSPSKRRTIESPCESSVWLEDYDSGELLPYGGFTTTRSFNYEVLYRFEVQMLDKAGREIPDLSYGESFQVYYGDEEPWPLRPLELWAPLGTTASLYGSWTIGLFDTNAERCATLGATEVAIDVASSTDFDFVDPVEVARTTCAEGELISEAVLAQGEYWVRYVALDAEGNELQSVYAEPLYLVDRPGELALDPADFTLP